MFCVSLRPELLSSLMRSLHTRPLSMLVFSPTLGVCFWQKSLHQPFSLCFSLCCRAGVEHTSGVPWHEATSGDRSNSYGHRAISVRPEQVKPKTLWKTQSLNLSTNHVEIRTHWTPLGSGADIHHGPLTKPVIRVTLLMYARMQELYFICGPILSEFALI